MMIDQREEIKKRQDELTQILSSPSLGSAKRHILQKEANSRID